MADRTQENLARIRACDADWNENDHPRADNGQFTSGSGGGGAKVSKATPGMTGGKFKTEAGAESDAYERYYAKEDRIHREKNKIDNEKEAAHQKYRKARNRLYGMANKAYHNGQNAKSEKYDDLAEKVEAKREEILSSYDPKIEGLAKRRQNAKAARNRELQNVAKTFKAAKATLEKARPGIRQMRADKLGYNKLTGEKASDHPEGEAHNLMVGALESAGGDFKKAQASLLESFGDNPKLAAAIKRLKPPAAAPASKKDALVKKINADPKLKAEVMSLKGNPKAPAAKPAKGTGWNRKRTIEFLNKEVLPQLKPGENFEHSDIPNMISMVEKFRRDNNATELHPKVENGFLSINGIKVGRIASAAPKGNYGGGYSPGMARAEGRILARQESDYD